MKTLTLEVPDAVPVDEKELVFILAAKLFEMGHLSAGKAAEMAGVSKQEFIEQVGKYGISWLGAYSEEDLMNDIKNA